MKNIFEKHEIKVTLSINELRSLIKVLSSSIPITRYDEGVIFDLHQQFSYRLQELEKENSV